MKVMKIICKTIFKILFFIIMEASKDTKAMKYYVNTNYTIIMADTKNIKLFFVRMDNLISRRPLFGPPFLCLCNFFQLSSFCGISLVDI